MKKLIYLGLGALFVSTAALAENRYILSETEEGTIRMDKQTGAVSYCKKVGSGIACSMAADERTALLEANEDMSERVASLEKRIELLESKLTASDQVVPEKVGPKAPETTLDKDEERQIDKAMRMAETVMRKFFTMAKELKNEFQSN